MLSLSEEDQEILVETVISQKLNVKQTEARVKQKIGPEKVKAQRFEFEKDLTDAREAVGKSLDSIEKSGIKYEHQAKDYDDYYEIKIKLFKH